MDQYYKDKDISYFSNVRHDLVNLLPKNPDQKILELGAGTGDTLVYIKQKGLASEVVGIELMQMPHSNQNNSLIDQFILTDIEKESLNFQKEHFDVIICGDVLEHLVDPWRIVNILTNYLRPGGVFIVSLPNFREINTLIKITLLGDFRYNPQGGILDKTHLRFFCKKNIINLFTTELLSPVFITPSFNKRQDQKKRKWINLFTLKLIEQFLAFQFLIIAKKSIK